MVAASEKSPAKPKGPKPEFHPGNPIPLSTRLAVRSFYLIQGLKPVQIAPLVGLSAPQVSQLAIREGWSKQRRPKAKERLLKAQNKQDAHAEEQISQIHEAIAIRTEELAVKTADRCADILSRTMEDGVTPAIDDKALQMSSGALRNFVQVARMSRGMDSRGPANAAQPQGGGATLIFVGALERTTPKELKPVEPAQPAIEISSSQVNT